MPSMSKVKDGYKVYNKKTKKSKIYKSKKKASSIVKKGYKSENIIENGGSDYGGQLFKAENWLN